MKAQRTKIRMEKDIERLVKSAKEWIVSSEGEQVVQAALENAKEVTARLSEARRVPPESLHDPVSL